MTLQGKGFFIWKIYKCEDGDVEKIASLAESAEISYVLVKIADGIIPSNVDPDTEKDYVPDLVAALRSRGIATWGWHYVYGESPYAEAKKAIERVHELNLDGYVIDAEIEYSYHEKKSAAKTFMKALRAGLPDLPVGLSTFRYPSYHQQFPWSTFLDQCDYNMPQVYWEYAHNPDAQLTRSVEELLELNPSRPVIPTAPTYKVNAWYPSSSDIKTFAKTARHLNLTSTNFFSWEACRQDLPDLWKEIKEIAWEVPSQINDITYQYIGALNSKNTDMIMDLYQSDAVHINSTRTIQGKEALKNWYTNFLEKSFADGEFFMIKTDSYGNKRNFTWRATSKNGSVSNGSDTFGLIDGKISYHYTHYTQERC